jgi:Putative antitoxin of bacterial toxin-antitoxin system, YdaS/YdaT
MPKTRIGALGHAPKPLDIRAYIKEERRGLKRTERGPTSVIAEACGINRQAVNQWKRVPAKWVLVVERVTGIAREKIRPDVYGPRL